MKYVIEFLLINNFHKMIGLSLGHLFLIKATIIKKVAK